MPTYTACHKTRRFYRNVRHWSLSSAKENLMMFLFRRKILGSWIKRRKTLSCKKAITLQTNHLSSSNNGKKMGRPSAQFIIIMLYQWRHRGRWRLLSRQGRSDAPYLLPVRPANCQPVQVGETLLHGLNCKLLTLSDPLPGTKHFILFSRIYRVSESRQLAQKFDYPSLRN